MPVKPPIIMITKSKSAPMIRICLIQSRGLYGGRKTSSTEYSKNSTKSPRSTMPSSTKAPSRSIISTIDIRRFFQFLVVSNSEPGQVALCMCRRPGAFELGEIGDHVEIQRGPRQSEHSSWNIDSAAIVQMTHQAHAAKSSRDGVSGRAAYDVGAGEVARGHQHRAASGGHRGKHCV